MIFLGKMFCLILLQSEIYAVLINNFMDDNKSNSYFYLVTILLRVILFDLYLYLSQFILFCELYFLRFML